MARALPIVREPPGRREAGPGAPGSSPRVAALEALWERARFRLYTPRHLFTWASLARQFNLGFVRPQSVKVEVPRGLLPDCESCLELCCTGPNAVVSLRLRDIASIVDGGHEAMITHQRPRAAGEVTEARLEADGSVFHQVFPVLKRDATGTCALLTEHRTCGAYPSWPLSCQRYPYAYDNVRRVVFLAKGCRSHRQMSLDDAPTAVRDLVDGAVAAYNERLKDVILLHVALEELHALGLTRHLQLEGALARKLARLNGG